MPTKKINIKQSTLKQISIDLKMFDFVNFDPRTDKSILMQHLQQINGKLGMLLREIDNATA